MAKLLDIMNNASATPREQPEKPEQHDLDSTSRICTFLDEFYFEMLQQNFQKIIVQP